MRVHAWRITKRKHAAVAFTGEGAEQAGGRWNTPGTRVVYTASSISLALLEILVHVGAEAILSAYALFPVEFDNSELIAHMPEDLPPGWDSNPPTHASQSVGDDWARLGRSLILQVPSAVVPLEANFLINPDHPRFGRLHIGDSLEFPIDPRLRLDSPL